MADRSRAQSDRRKQWYWAPLLSAVLILLPAGAAGATVNSITAVRWSDVGGVLRLVFDCSTVPQFTYQMAEDDMTLTVAVDNAIFRGQLPRIRSPRLQGLDVKASQTGTGLIITVRTTNPGDAYRAFALSQPARLVIDIGNRTLAGDSGRPVSTRGGKIISRTLAPGMVLQTGAVIGPAGPVWTYLLEVDPRQGWELRPVLAAGAVIGRQTVSGMATTTRATAAVNGSYFMNNGEIIGLLKIDGQIASTDGVVRSAIGIMPDGGLIFGQPEFSGRLRLPDGRQLAISAVNRQRGENSLVLYNHYYANRTGSNQFGVEYTIDAGGVVTRIDDRGNSPIPADGGVLSAHGLMAAALTGLRAGDKVSLIIDLGDSEWNAARHVIGAGPTLVRGGRRFVSAVAEQFPPDIAVGRAPRTAIGRKADGTVVLLVVDGRRDTSVGMTLEELADFLIARGVVEAVNLDGGGSSEMWIQGSVINRPSDGRERPVGDAVAIYRRGGNDR
ncbi:MAG: phosphodiester glycosidase family protein [Negativicutes bacterium]|nr:phosphodiester glycosidase family protein [Negativicutes bacterium]